VAAALAACHPRARPVDLPPPAEVTTVGVGDVFTMRIMGEKDLPDEFTVAPDGTVDLPYVQRVKVAGLEPQELSALVRQRLMEKKIHLDPSVTVSIKAYNSKRVEISGEVKQAGSLPLEPGMTLVRAISKAGGLTPLAKTDQVVLRRRIRDRTIAVTVDYDAIINNEIPDVALQAGDTIHVGQRVF
jgi:polysaccharide export outer membrane protein